MAGAARIGALHVMLGLDSAEFTAGLAKANAGLSKFGKAAKIGLEAVATAAAAAGAALAVAVKGSIDRADDLSKTAQRIGMTTEALSRLEWAAKLSDVSLEQLSTGLQRLSRNMLDVSNGVGAQAKTAFDALGISVVDAEGKLRSSDAVFSEIANRFATMPDSAEKTALAMQLLGRAGAQMIPLLNAGADGLADMAAESDQLGNTISTNTGYAAERFNDSLTRVQAVMGGVVNKIMEAVLPSLNRFGDLLASPEFAANAQQIGTAIVDAMGMAVEAVNAAVGAFNGLREAMAWASTHDMFGNKLEPSQWDIMKGKIDARNRLAEQLNAGNTGVDVASLYRGIFAGQTPAAVAEPLADVADALSGIGAGAGSASAGIANLNSEVAASVPQMTEMQRVGEDLASSLASGFTDIFTGMIDGTKSVTQGFADMFKNIGQQFLQSGLQRMLSGLFGGLFGGNSLGGGWGVAGGFGRPGIFGIPGFANGTSFAPGGLAMVGERGPELVNLPRGSEVIPNEALGGPTINISISGSRQDAAEIAREVRKVLPDAIQSYNRNPLRRS